AVQRDREQALGSPLERVRAPAGVHHGRRSVAFQHIEHFLEAVLHLPSLSTRRNLIEEDRGVVAPAVQMNKGSACLRKAPRTGIQRQQIQSEAFVDRDALFGGPIPIGVQAESVLGHGTHSWLPIGRSSSIIKSFMLPPSKTKTPPRSECSCLRASGRTPC